MDHNHLTIKTFMSIMAERDAAIQERNLALDERKRAFAERDLAMLQRDTALLERNSAIQERDEAISTLHFRSNFINNNNNITTTTSKSTQNTTNHKSKHTFNDHIFQVPDTCQKKIEKKRVKPEPDFSTNEEIELWKDELGLNEVNFDESVVAVPVCSCTGVPQPCYRWGNGGWQSACCTTTMSLYPLPQVSNKRYSRVGGRKMSGGAFTKLLTRLASEGYDLSTPLDLKDHWAKHGTNRYSTVK